MLRSLKVKALGCVAKDTDEYFFGRAKTGGLGRVTTKKTKKDHGKKMGITRPRPDGGVKNTEKNGYY